MTTVAVLPTWVRFAKIGAGGARAQSRRAQSGPLAVVRDSQCQTAQPNSTAKQRSVVRSRGALLRPGLSVSSQAPSLSRPPGEPTKGFGVSGRRDSSNSVPPMRGGWSADRRTLSFGRACDARPPCPGATGTSLGAPPWRFRMRTHAAGSRQWNRSLQRLPAPRRKAWRSGSGPPCVAVRAAAWDATPCSVLQDRLRKTPLHERE